MKVISLLGKSTHCACADPLIKKKILMTTNEKTGYPNERDLIGWKANMLRMRRSTKQKENSGNYQ